MPFENPEKESKLAPHEVRDLLLSNKITPEEFLDKLLELDQSTGHHDAALENIEILTEPAIRELFTEESAYDFGYSHLLSISYFHVGQNMAMAGDEVEAVFRKSLEAAERLPASDLRWAEYVRATVAYFTKDINELARVYATLPEGNNKKIIGNMLKGLQSRGTVDYRADYRLQ